MRTALVVAFVFGVSSAATAETWLKSWDAHGRSVQLSDYRGKVVALTFAGKHTRDEATEVNDELAELAGDDAVVLSAVDLEDVPDFGKGTARKKIAESDRPGVLQHVVDDRGTLARAFNADPKQSVAILVIDKNGELRGRFENGLRDLPQAEKLIRELKDEPSRYGSNARRGRNLASEKR
jgi:hypothetical protein